MLRVQRILELRKVLPYLESRGLLKQYRKAKTYLLDGNFLQVKFKERNPKGNGIWYFRINRQYRALGTFDNGGNLIIFKINDHQ